MDTKGETGRAELDSHTDIGCAGLDCAVLSLTGTAIHVYPFSTKSNKVVSIPIAYIAYAVTCSILVLHEQLIFGEKLPYSLLNTNQLLSHCVVVANIPK